MPQLIPAAQVCPKLLELYGNSGTGYRKFYALALDGRIPVVRVNGRLFVDETDMPLIAEALGVAPASRAA